MPIRERTAPEVDALGPLDAIPSLSDRVYEVLKRHLAERRLAPGSKLSVPRLARQLDVSRTPVKEALERLVRDGLVTTLPKRGAFVAILRTQDVDEIYQMREMLEGLAARLAAPAVDEPLVHRLRDLLEVHRAAVERDDLDAHVSADVEFHRAIRQRAGNRRLIHALDILQDQIRIVFKTSAAIPGRMRKAVEEHRAILAALERRDPDAAEAAARTHIRRIREAVLAHLDAGHLQGAGQVGR
ncbi:MAG: GntR family transcriptional regulator [Armatimonadota bacterium]|nr:GntR family transcriptional regulator [Armatimonadota bacterium]